MKNFPCLASPGDQAEQMRKYLLEQQSWIRQVLSIRSADPQAVDELFQEFIVSVLKSDFSIQQAEPPPAWLYVVAVRTALMHRRRLGRRRRMLHRYATSASRQYDEESTPDPLGLLLAKEREKLIQSAIARLLPKDQELLTLKYTQGWSYCEISKHLGLTESQVTTQLHRARVRLRQLLSAHFLLSETTP